ncbi:MAG TPA: hypothetical protein VHZ51_09740 [Ktedonobacteraceae bacterium]|nr:hypothetical protein [Ktedonobacteraceae bacterium]
MPKQRYERREPTHEWSQIRPLLKDSTQIHYEILRPIVLFGVSPQERSVETGISKTTLYAKANLFDQVGMASCCPQLRRQRSRSRISGRFRPRCARPLLMRTQSIQDCRYTRLPASAMYNSIARPRITPISWCWQTDLRPRARRGGFPALPDLRSRQSGETAA